MLLMLSAVVYTMVKGQGLERLTAIIMLLAYIASPVVQDLSHLKGFQGGITVIDFALLAYLFAAAMFSYKYWPLWACAFQGVSVVMHFSLLIDETIWTRALLTGSVILSYLVIATLVVGTALETKRRAPVA